MSPDRGHRLQAVVDETGEPVNHPGLAQWAHYAKLRADFHLYVPAGMVDVARRLAEDNHIHAAEIWSYHIVGDQPRFTLVHRSRETPPGVRIKASVVVTANRPKPAPAAVPVPIPAPAPAPVEPAPKPVLKPAPKPAAKPVAKPVKPAAKPAVKPKVAKARPVAGREPEGGRPKPRRSRQAQKETA